MPNFKGLRLMKDQKWDEKYPGWIFCGEGKFRQPYLWKNKPANRYAFEKQCSNCGLMILQDMANAKKAKNAFCSKQCTTEFLKKNSSGNKIKKLREHGEGYHVLIKVHGHPRADRHGNVYEHILVAEEKLKRPILNYERVHHINCVKNDNRPENLFVCSSNKEHFLIHGSLNKCAKTLLEMGVLVFNENAKMYEVKI